MAEEEFVASKANKELGLELLKAVDEAAQKAASRFDTPPVLICGGAVRDTFFGLVPKDVDIFVDVSGSHEDQVDDLFVLLGTDILQTLREGGRFYSDNHRVSKLAPESHGEYAGLSATEGGGQFTIYETDYIQFEDKLVPAAERPPIDIFDQDMFNIQLISRCTPLLHQDKTEFVQSFDYPLVKCYWDNGLVLTEDFNGVLRTKELAVTNGRWGTPEQRTYDRITNFWMKYDELYRRKTGKAIPINFVFEQVKRTKSKKVHLSVQEYAAVWNNDAIQLDPFARFDIPAEWVQPNQDPLQIIN